MGRSMVGFSLLAISLSFFGGARAEGGLQADPSDMSMQIAINGWAEPSVFAQSDPVTVTVSLDPDGYAGVPADWWLLAQTETGDFYYYADSAWNGPVPVTQLRPAVQGALSTVSGATVLQGSSGLGTGRYRFYFGVDEINGTIDPDIVYTYTDLAIVPSTASFATGTGTGTLRKEGALWIMNLQGDYYDMGRQYGALAGDPLLAMFSICDRNIGFTNSAVQLALSVLESFMDDRERLLIYGMSQETLLTFEQLHFIGACIMFSYEPATPALGCSVFGATRSQTTTGATLIGRNFDNPSFTMNELAGRSAVIVYNPVNEARNGHRDNSVSAVTTLGWLFGATVMNSKGLNFEYLNGMISVTNLNLTIPDGLHQNLYAAFDCDTLAEVDARYLNSSVALATLTQVSDETNLWHYERSPLENSMKVLAGQATNGQYYASLVDEDIHCNHFYFTNHVNQSFQYTSPSNDSASQSFQRLVNLQTLARQHVGSVSMAVLQHVMTTKFADGGTYWDPATAGTADQNVYVCVTDVKNKIIAVFPSCERERAAWVQLNLNQEFR